MHELRNDPTSEAGRLIETWRWRHALAIFVALCAAFLQVSPAWAMPILSEVYYDAVGSDNGVSFVEIHGDPGTILDGLTLEGVNGLNGAIGPVVGLVGVIPVDGLFVVADSDSGGSTNVPDPDQVANFDFQNGPDSITLMNGDLVLDAVGYGVFSASEIFAGEGSPAPDVPAGSSLARLFADIDSDDNLADFVILAVPTPGSADYQVIPEPGSGVLLTAGLLTLASIGRRRRDRRIREPGV